MGRRGRPRFGRGSAVCNCWLMADRSSAIPCPVRAETGRMGALASTVPANFSCISSWTSSTQSGSSTMSSLVRTMRLRGMASRSKMARCSAVWGITPSSAAMTNKAKSMPPTPASMFSMKSRWPGTSTTPTSSANPSSFSHAKPRSMVISRSFSSRRRSGSMPVRARTRVDLPWSTCPAVPMTYIPMKNDELQSTNYDISRVISYFVLRHSYFLHRTHCALLMLKCGWLRPECPAHGG